MLFNNVLLLEKKTAQVLIEGGFLYQTAQQTNVETMKYR